MDFLALVRHDLAIFARNLESGLDDREEECFFELFYGCSGIGFELVPFATYLLVAILPR